MRRSLLFVVVIAVLGVVGGHLPMAGAQSLDGVRSADPIAQAAALALAAVAPENANVGQAGDVVVASATLIASDGLAELATRVAERVKVDENRLLEVWRATDVRRLKVLLSALAQVGTMYRYGGNKPGGFDCSGLTSFAWASVGVKLPRISTDQISAVPAISVDQIRPGDLLWRPGHIGMAIGVDDLMVNATQTGRPVEVKRWGRVVRLGSPLP